MASERDPGLIRLTVPAQADFVSVVRVAGRVVAGRAGCSDDARSRLQASVGTAFFALIEGLPADGSVETTFVPGDRAVTLEMRRPPEGKTPPPAALDGIGDGRELVGDGATLRFWVAS